MLRLLLVAISGAALVAALGSDYEGGTGTRSLWIPYKTLVGTPAASILGVNSANHQTTYVISCASVQPQCAIAPNITLTEGTDIAQWTSTTSGSDVSGTVAISCHSLATGFPVTCHQNAIGSDRARKTSQILQSDDVAFQAVDVTATMSETSTANTADETASTTMDPPTSTVAAGQSTSASTGAATPTAGSNILAAGAVLGGGLLLLGL